jgi:hypothetical protein
MAKRISDGAVVLLVVNPKFGVMSQTPVALGPSVQMVTGVAIDNFGTVYAGTWGSSAYRAFAPIYATAVP